MSIFGKDFLERVKSRGASAKPQESVSQSENGENGAEQPNSTEELAREARTAGPLILGPCLRLGVKGSWRDDACLLEEFYPEEFGPPRNQPSSVPCVERSLCPGLVDSAPTVEPQPVANVPESPQSAPAALPAPPPPPLASAFWQALLYGSPDALLSPGDANTALRLVARVLPIGNDDPSEAATIFDGEFSGTVRVSALRKALSERFGADAWPAMNKLWRSAPLSPGGAVPNEDQSQCSPGVRECPRSMPAWRREFLPGGQW